MNHILSDAEGNTSESLNRGGIADLPKLIVKDFPKIVRTKFPGGDGLLCFNSMSSLADSSTILQKLLTSVGLRQRRFIPIAKIIEMISMSKGSSTRS